MGKLSSDINTYNERYTADADRMAKHFIDAAAELKESGKTVLIFPHRSVDGDCVGSACGLTLIMRALGADAYVAMPEKIPEDMAFLHVEDLLFYPWDDASFEQDRLINGKPYGAAFAVDCSEGSRMGECGKFFDEFSEHLIVDHHQSVKDRNDDIWVMPEASSASELCFYIALSIERITGIDVIDARAAECLMAGIVTDTGRFTYTNTKPETLIAAGILMERGASINDVCYNLFDRVKIGNYRISAAARLTTKFFADGKIAVTFVPRELFDEYGADAQGVDDVVAAMRDIDGVELAIMLRVLENGSIRGNLRSKSYFDCSKLAAQFGGGGHAKASGFTGHDIGLTEFADQVLEAAMKMI
ncbi:MAG: bifunctional oligoribonuclease/PAP phosphatase NrnA [Clostridiales bacterium]|nr:bifunctional oligoribonuclease/PAP phosphatase NrnA [Clostridiales bacterium]